jgi:hypothetical protein
MSDAGVNGYVWHNARRLRAADQGKGHLDTRRSSEFTIKLRGGVPSRRSICGEIINITTE